MNSELCALLGLLHSTWTHIKIKNNVLLGRKLVFSIRSIWDGIMEIQALCLMPSGYLCNCCHRSPLKGKIGYKDIAHRNLSDTLSSITRDGGTSASQPFWSNLQTCSHVLRWIFAFFLPQNWLALWFTIMFRNISAEMLSNHFPTIPYLNPCLSTLPCIEHSWIRFYVFLSKLQDYYNFTLILHSQSNVKFKPMYSLFHSLNF